MLPKFVNPGEKLRMEAACCSSSGRSSTNVISVVGAVITGAVLPIIMSFLFFAAIVNKGKGSVGRDVYIRDWYYVNREPVIEPPQS